MGFNIFDEILKLAETCFEKDYFIYLIIGIVAVGLWFLFFR